MAQYGFTVTGGLTHIGGDLVRECLNDEQAIAQASFMAERLVPGCMVVISNITEDYYMGKVVVKPVWMPDFW